VVTEGDALINHTMLGARACHQPKLDGERTETIVGHCVNVRHLGKLAFFTLRSQTSNLQVVCTSKEVIDALRIVDDFALVEVSGVIQRKRRRHEQDPLEHELNATTLRRVGSDAARAAEIVGEPSGAQKIFNCIEPIVRGSILVNAVRKVLSRRGIMELPPPDALPFVDRQALASFTHDDGSRAHERIYCLHPPFHAYSRFLAAGGLYRFAFFSSAIEGGRVLHIAVCQPDAAEMRAMFGEVADAMEGASGGSRPLNDNGSDGDSCSSSPQQSRARQLNERSRTDWPGKIDLVLDIERTLTARERQLNECFQISERQMLFRSGAAVAHYCVIAACSDTASGVELTQGDELNAAASWLRLLRAGIRQPIPRVGLLTLIADDRGDVVGPRHPARVSGAVSDPSADPMGGETHSQARAAHVAQLAEAELLRVEIEILRGHAPGVGEMARPMTIESALCVIESVLPAYNLPLSLVLRLLDICRLIHPEWRTERPVDLFQMIWTLLGSASVKSLLHVSKEAFAVLEQLIELRIISDKRQLLYLHPAVLPAFDAMLSRTADDTRAALVVQLRTLMAQRPTLFATTAQTLAVNWPPQGQAERTYLKNLQRWAELGIATPLLTRLASSLCDDEGRLSAFLGALRKTGETAFRNETLQLAALAAAFARACPETLTTWLRKTNVSADDELGREILYYLYRPVTMDYVTFCEMFHRLKDCTQDWVSWGITEHGDFWNSTLGCYEYWLDRGRGEIGKVQLYVSKNIGSFFAKSTAGICTDVNVELFERFDHFHLNLVDPADGRVAGNVQLYIGEGARGRFLMVRGINPIREFCIKGSVDELVRCILHAIYDMAVFGGYSEVRLCEQNGLWNSDSSRVEVRASLQRLRADIPSRPMEQAFHLYDYHGRALTVNSYYRVWEADSQSSAFPFTTDGTTG
jgi:hypothetical protein